MTTPREHLESALAPLRLLNSNPDVPPLCIDPLEADAIPEPFRALLVHARDMTQTLQAYHNQRIHLEVQQSIHGDSTYVREVTLNLDCSRRPVEYGAICFYLDRISAPLRADILADDRPLGALLAEAGASVTHAPGPYFRVTPDRHIMRLLSMHEANPLYGRCNTIRGDTGEPIAQVVEILHAIDTKDAPDPKSA